MNAELVQKFTDKIQRKIDTLKFQLELNDDDVWPEDVNMAEGKIEAYQDAINTLRCSYIESIDEMVDVMSAQQEGS